MKIVGILISVLFVGTSPIFADVCDDFKASLSVEATVSNVTVVAGTEIKVPLRINVDSDEASKWSSINMSSGFFNGIEGSRGVFETYFLKDDQGQLNLPKELSFQTAANMGGAYRAGVSIYAQDPSYAGHCYKRFDELPGLKLNIENDVDDIDIDPPKAVNIRFKKDSYKVGETVEILFEAQDKSEICTVWKANNGKCGFGTHVELAALDGESTISFHTPTPIFKTKEKGGLLAVVPLSEEYATEDFQPGRYRLVHFMFQDIHGNYFNEMPANSHVIVEFK